MFCPHGPMPHVGRPHPADLSHFGILYFAAGKGSLRDSASLRVLARPAASP